MEIKYQPSFGNTDPYIVADFEKNEAVWYVGLNELVDIDLPPNGIVKPGGIVRP